jgi:hypothetical protein
MGTLVGALLLGAIFVVVGGILLALGVNNYRDGEATKSWESTSARVLSADVREDVDTKRDSNGRSRTRTTYKPVIRYEYMVDGNSYQGNRIRFGDYQGGEDRAYDAINRYPAGSNVPVYYDPANPGDAVLEQGADQTGVYLFGGIGGGFVIIGLAALALGGIFYRRVTRSAIYAPAPGS